MSHGTHLPVAELPHNPVDDGDVLVLHVVHHYLPDLFQTVLATLSKRWTCVSGVPYVCLLYPVPIPQEEEISALKSRFHATTEDDDYRRRRVCKN